MKTWMPTAILGCATVSLTAALWNQGRQIERLTMLVEGTNAQAQMERSQGPHQPIHNPTAQRRVSRAVLSALEHTVAEAEETTFRYGDAQATDDTAAPSFDPTRNKILEVLESYEPEVRDRFRAIVQEEQDRLREERQQLRKERWSERTKTRLQELQHSFDLSPAQADFLWTRLSTEYDTVRGIFREARIDHSFGEAHDKARDVHTETDAEVREELDEDQLAAYEQMRQKEAERHTGRWRRPIPDAQKKPDDE